MKVLVLGCSGMLGNALIRTLSSSNGIDCWGTVRSSEWLRFFPSDLRGRLIKDADVLNEQRIESLIRDINPDCIVNCIGVIKQLSNVNDPLQVLPINSMLPHRLVRLAAEVDARVIHISTDCVFSGQTGLYKEEGLSDVNDLYGMSKFIGELRDYDNALTLRTSIIGHELASTNSLVDWFLNQSRSVNGYEKAIFSGLPTNELAQLIVRCIIEFKELNGLYHVAAEPINKYELLCILRDVYDKNIQVLPDSLLTIDRSLDASRFNAVTGYKVKPWPQLIQEMKSTYEGWVCAPE